MLHVFNNKSFESTVHCLLVFNSNMLCIDSDSEPFCESAYRSVFSLSALKSRLSQRQKSMH